MYSFDNSLFPLIAQGSEEAFRKFVHHTYRTLFPFVISIIKSEAGAEDVLQEVFLKIWLRRDTLPSIENPMAWVNTIIVNTASNHLRTQLRNEIRIKKAYHGETGIETMDDHLEARFTQLLIDEAVNRLPAGRKKIFLLSRTEGLSRQEIAARLNISENTVRNQLAEALKFVQNYLNQNTPVAIAAFFMLHHIIKNISNGEWYN